MMQNSGDVPMPILQNESTFCGLPQNLSNSGLGVTYMCSPDSGVRLTMNLDLPEDLFLRLAFKHSDVVQPSAKARRGCRTENAEGCRRAPIEVVVFFERRTNPNSIRVEQAVRTINESLRNLQHSGLTERVRGVKLIDCGDDYRPPLSDLAVLGQYLEAISLVMPGDVDARIMTGDYERPEQRKPNCVFRDTRSEDFISHYAEFIRKSVQTLNKHFGQGDLPKVGRANIERLAAALAGLTAAD